MSLSELPLDTRDAWTRARDRYVEDLSEEEKPIFLDASIENIFYTASVAQKTHQSSSVGRRIGSKLQPVVAAIDQYGKALDVYANTSSLIMCPLWGSIRVLLHVSHFNIFPHLLPQITPRTIGTLSAVLYDGFLSTPSSARISREPSKERWPAWGFS